MANRFINRYSKHDFSSIVATISTYFPIQNPEQFQEKDISDFEGVAEISKILHENFFINKNYKECWLRFKKFLKQELKKPIYETMVAFYPCYSGTVTLKKENNKNLTYSKELHFFISLLGPYYTIFGIDKVEVELDEFYAKLSQFKEARTRTYSAILAITTSPYLEYQELFLLLQQKLMAYFPHLRFVPYEINRNKIAGISLVYPDSECEVKDSVFSALFRPDNFFHSETRGETNYGFDEWLIFKKLSQERISEIKEEFLRKSLESASKLTLHKVWKFKSANRIPGSSSVTFLMDPIRILDLTADDVVTLVSEEDEEPETLRYSVVNNRIVFENLQDKYYFKIAELAINELTLTLHINLIVDDEKTIKGDILNMTFEIFK